MIGWMVMVIGGVISVVGAIGLLRFPDVYTRAHAQTVINVGGTCLIMIGSFLEEFSLIGFKTILIILFIFLTAPVGTHAITRSAYLSGIKPKIIFRNDLKKLKIEKLKQKHED